MFLCTVTDAVDKRMVTTTAEKSLDGWLRLAGGRRSSASFASDDSQATLSASSSTWRKAVSSGLHSTPDGSNFDLLS